MDGAGGGGASLWINIDKNSTEDICPLNNNLIQWKKIRFQEFAVFAVCIKILLQLFVRGIVIKCANFPVFEIFVFFLEECHIFSEIKL